MATKVGEAYYELTAKNGKLRSKLQESDKMTASWTKKMSGAIKKFGKLAFAGAVAGVTALTAATIKAVKAAAAEELQTEQLAHQIGRLGINAESAMKEVDKLASSQQTMTRFGDTQTRQMMSTLIMLSNDYEASLRNLDLAQDLAESGLFDQRSAARLLGMAMSGNIEILGRYIPELKTSNNEALKTMTRSEKAAFAVETLREKFGGLAKQVGSTTAGAWAKYKNAVSDAWEALGTGALEATEDGLVDIAGTIKDMEPELRELGKSAAWFVEQLTHAAKWWTELFAQTEGDVQNRIEDVKALNELFGGLAKRISNLRDEQVISTKVAEEMLNAWQAPLMALQKGEISYEQALEQLLSLEKNFAEKRIEVEEDVANRQRIVSQKQIEDEKKARKEAIEFVRKELREDRLKRLGMEETAEILAVEDRYEKILEKVREFEDLKEFVVSDREAAMAAIRMKFAEEATKKEKEELDKRLAAEERAREERIAGVRNTLEQELSKNQSLMDALKDAEQDFLRSTGQMKEAEMRLFNEKWNERLRMAEGNSEQELMIQKARIAELTAIQDKEREEEKKKLEEMNRFRRELIGAAELGRRAILGGEQEELKVKVEPSDEDKRHTEQFKRMIELQEAQVENTRSNIAVLGP